MVKEYQESVILVFLFAHNGRFVRNRGKGLWKK